MHEGCLALPHCTATGAQQLRFLHPVANGRDPGGWMVEEKQRAGEGEGAPACLPVELALPLVHVGRWHITCCPPPAPASRALRPWPAPCAGAAPSELQQEEQEAEKAGKGWDSLRAISWDEASSVPLLPLILHCQLLCCIKGAAAVPGTGLHAACAMPPWLARRRMAANPHCPCSKLQSRLRPPSLLCPQQIKQHTSRESCWIVRDGRVYDPTKFLDAHPGGPSAILSNAGGCGAGCSRRRGKQSLLGLPQQQLQASVARGELAGWRRARSLTSFGMPAAVRRMSCRPGRQRRVRSHPLCRRLPHDPGWAPGVETVELQLLRPSRLPPCVFTPGHVGPGLLQSCCPAPLSCRVFDWKGGGGGAAL